MTAVYTHTASEASSFPKIEYALFDMDGLLSELSRACLDTERIYTEVTNGILGEFGCSLGWDVKAQVMGSPARLSSETVLRAYGLLDKISVDEFIRRKETMIPQKFREVAPMRGAVRLVQHLHKHGVPIALATGSGYQAFLNKSTHLPYLFELFPVDAIVTADSPEVMPGRGKPCPDVFLAAAKKLGRDVGEDEEPVNDLQRAERSKGLVFEDAVFGAQAGVRAGMNVVWVPDVELLALDPEATHGAKVIHEHLEDFKPEQWGLPPFDDGI